MPNAVFRRLCALYLTTALCTLGASASQPSAGSQTFSAPSQYEPLERAPLTGQVVESLQAKLRAAGTAQKVVRASKFSSQTLPKAVPQSITKPSKLQAKSLAATTATLPGPVAGCTSINTNTVYTDVTAPAGYYYCYQFVVNDPSKIDAVFQNFPTAGAITTYLFPVAADGSWGGVLTDVDGSGASNQLLATVSQPARFVLVVNAGAGTGGQQFAFVAFTGTGYDPYEANDKTSTLTALGVNTTINANIDIPGVDNDYYIVPLAAGKKSASVRVTHSANIAANAAMLAFNSSTNSWTLISQESSLPTSDVHYQFNFNNSPPATQYGVLVHVAGVNPSAPANESYTLTPTDNDQALSSFSIYSTNTIVQLLPPPLFQGEPQIPPYRNIYGNATVSVHVTTATGVPVPSGIPVTFYFTPDGSDVNSRQIATTATTTGGLASFSFTIPSCNGNSGGHYSPTYGTNADYYTTRWNFGSWTASLPYSDTNPNPPASPQFFVTICSEQYFGRF